MIKDHQLFDGGSSMVDWGWLRIINGWLRIINGWLRMIEDAMAICLLVEPSLKLCHHNMFHGKHYSNIWLLPPYSSWSHGGSGTSSNWMIPWVQNFSRESWRRHSGRLTRCFDPSFLPLSSHSKFCPRSHFEHMHSWPQRLRLHSVPVRHTAADFRWWHNDHHWTPSDTVARDLVHGKSQHLHFALVPGSWDFKDSRPQHGHNTSRLWDFHISNCWNCRSGKCL